MQKKNFYHVSEILNKNHSSVGEMYSKKVSRVFVLLTFRRILVVIILRSFQKRLAYDNKKKSIQQKKTIEGWGCRSN